MAPSGFQTTLDSYITPYSDEPDTQPQSIPSIFVTPPSTPPPYNTAISISPNQSSTSPVRVLSVPPTPSDLEKGLPPSYFDPSSPSRTSYLTPTEQHEHQDQYVPNQNHRQLVILLPNETTHFYLNTESRDTQRHPSYYQILTFIHISAALLTGIEILDLLYLQHVDQFDVLGGGIFGAPLILLWGLLGSYFGSGVALCFL
jgi:hypothetical protein